MVFGGAGDDILLAGGNDAAKDTVIGDNGRMTFGGTAVFDEGEESATLSINFGADSQKTVITGTAGAEGARADHWNNLSGRGSNSNAGDATDRFLFFDDGSVAPGIRLTWGRSLDSDPKDLSSSDHQGLEPNGDQDVTLFEGSLYHSREHTVGVDISGMGSYFASYDIYVYLDLDDRRSQKDTSVRRISDGTTSYYLDDPRGHSFTGTYELVTSTDPNAPQIGNYVVFRGLSLDTFSLRIDDEGGDGSNKPGISGIQLVGRSLPIDRIETTSPGVGGNDYIVTGDGSDFVLGGYGRDTIQAGAFDVKSRVDDDIVVGDNGRATLMAGEIRTVKTTHPISDWTQDFAFDDLIITGAGNDLVFGGDGSDIIQTGQEGQFDSVDLSRLPAGFDAAIPPNLAMESANPLDINVDGRVSALDALYVINFLSTATRSDRGHGESEGKHEKQKKGKHYPDSNGDGHVTPLDALLIINHLSHQGTTKAEDQDRVIGDNGSAIRFGGKVYQLTSTNAVQVPNGVQSDHILTGLGDDIIIGGNGADWLSGGSDDDLIFGDNAVVQFVQGRTSWSEVISPSIGGDDTLRGGAGNDTVVGQRGDDTYLFAGVQLGSDRLIESDGSMNDSHDLLDFRLIVGGVSIDLAEEHEQNVIAASRSQIVLSLTLSSGNAFEDVIATSQSDSVDGNGRNNTLVGGDGDDKIDARQGMDVLIGGLGADKLHGGSKSGHGDLLIGGSTIHDKDVKRLRELSDLWTSGDPYIDIVNRLTAGLLASANVTHDRSKDELTGHDNSVDLFFAESGLDKVKGDKGDTKIRR